MHRGETVSVIVMDQNERFLLVRSRWRRRWEYPGGYMRSATSVHVAAFSELIEKTGLVLGMVHSIRTSAELPKCVFVISYDCHGLIRLDRSVYTDYRWVHPIEASALLSPMLYDQAERFLDF
jgi:8-oxo-dGTP pyrophosphatase MutT (NUDIX family)